MKFKDRLLPSLLLTIQVLEAAAGLYISIEIITMLFEGKIFKALLLMIGYVSIQLFVIRLEQEFKYKKIKLGFSWFTKGTIIKVCNFIAILLIVIFFSIGIYTEIHYDNPYNPYLIALAFTLFLIAMYILSKCQTK